MQIVSLMIVLHYQVAFYKSHNKCKFTYNNENPKNTKIATMKNAIGINNIQLARSTSDLYSLLLIFHKTLHIIGSEFNVKKIPNCFHNEPVGSSKT